MATRKSSPYPYWFVAPAATIYIVLFLLPSVASFWFALTRWTYERRGGIANSCFYHGCNIFEKYVAVPITDPT